MTRFDRRGDRLDLAADLTGFEPATSALTGRRALQAAPQVRNGVSRAVRGFDVRLPFEQPFTVAECRGEPHGGIIQVQGLREGGLDRCHSSFELLESVAVERLAERCHRELIGHGLGFSMLVANR